jgi:DNA-binding GntR family transcriptional regulator
MLHGMDSSPSTNFDVVRSQTLTRLVQEEVIRQIKGGELLAGAKLNELELSQRLNISRGPAREAFAALEEAGLIRLEKNRGAFVRQITKAEAVELYQVRCNLDEFGGRLLASSITASQIDELEFILKVLDDCIIANDPNQYFEVNIDFHDAIIRMTGNSTLLGLYRQLVNRMHLLRRRGLLKMSNCTSSRIEHRLIVDALRRHDPDDASHQMGNHVKQGYYRFAKTYEVDGES